jgi:hypothetical protein
MFQLKKGQEAFTVVEGPYKNRTFRPGETYTDIPPQEAGKFAETKKAAPAKAAVKTESAKPAKAESKKAIVFSSSEKGGR